MAAREREKIPKMVTVNCCFLKNLCHTFDHQKNLEHIDIEGLLI